ncbi:MAG: hypothetical protein GX066_03070 [Clostridiaceae bacterium]|nr:hypothetical protein [Clostridiaceae bacterium]
MKDLFNGCIGLEGFFAGYHSYPGIWLEDDNGNLVYGSVQPETKVALGRLAQLYKSGQLDKEFGIKDVSKVANAIAEGKIGITFGEQWNPIYPLSSSFNNDNNADWQGYPLVSADDKPVRVPLRFRTHLYFAVRKGYEHPEAVVKMINLYLGKNWGAKNEFDKYYMPHENGSVSVWKFSPVTPFPPYKNLNAFLEIEKARKNNDMSVLKGEARAIQNNIEAYARGDKCFWGWEKIYGVNGVYNVLKQYIANDSLLLDKFTTAPTKTMVQKKAALDKYEKEVFVRIIMGDADLDEFDKFVENWNKLGGNEIVREVNEWYKSLKNQSKGLNQ